MPDRMNYLTSGIVCLASDLRETGLILQEKRTLAGDVVKNIDDIDQTASDVALCPNLPAVTWYKTSRLIIVGHGNEQSTHIMGDGVQWDAKQLAENISRWLKNSNLKRISLHMCFGGGNRGAALGTDFKAFQVHPTQSFAYKLASHCSLAETITARTEETTLRRHRNRAGVMTNAWRVVGADGKEQHKGKGDKVIFTPQGGTLHNPVNPRISY